MSADCNKSWGQCPTHDTGSFHAAHECKLEPKHEGKCECNCGASTTEATKR